MENSTSSWSIISLAPMSTPKLDQKVCPITQVYDFTLSIFQSITERKKCSTFRVQVGALGSFQSSNFNTISLIVEKVASFEMHNTSRHAKLFAKTRNRCYFSKRCSVQNVDQEAPVWLLLWPRDAWQSFYIRNGRICADRERKIILFPIEKRRKRIRHLGPNDASG